MGKKIVILGTANTKAEQLEFLREQIILRGHEAIIMDLSMGGYPNLSVDIPPQEIAALVGKTLEELIASRDRFFVTNAMSTGAQQKALELLSRNCLDGIVALGGLSMALVASQVMSGLPFGIPKVIATPAAMPSYVGSWFSATDLVVMQLIVDIASMNDLVKDSIVQVAGAVAGMVDRARGRKPLELPYPSIAVTQLGFAEKCAKHVVRFLTERGYHAFPFHAQGIGDRAMDRLIAQGLFDGVIEIVPAGLIEAKYEGNRAADMNRLKAACERGIPQVLAPCCLNLTGAGMNRKNREKYINSGRFLKIDEMRTMARFPKDELVDGARLYAEKLNKAKGPIKWVIPLRGWSSLDQEGSVLYDPEEDRIFVEEMKKNLVRPIEIEEVDCNLEDERIARALVDSLDECMGRRRDEEKVR